MTEQAPVRDLRAELALIVVVTLWAANFPVAKWGIEGLGVFAFNSLRYIVASLVLSVIFFARSGWTPLHREDLGKILVVSFIASLVYQMVFILGLSLTSPGNSAVLLSTAPLWIVFISSIMHKEEIRRNVWIGMAVSLCGVLLIILGSGKEVTFGSSGVAGDLITLGAAMLWGLSTNLQKPLLVRYSALQLNLIMALVGAVGLTLIAIPAMLTIEFGAVDNSYYAAGIASGALSIGVANMLWSVGVKRLGPSHAGNFGNLVPVLAFVFAWAALGEPVHLQQGIGAAVVLFGVMLARRRKKQ
ncbi:MAG: DMT family transporter [Ignavibacteria bacterium]|nr:DMT family transporter [Ignavibacteria bacterium]